jgi:hypothetical protein
MRLKMNGEQLQTLGQVEQFLTGSQPIAFKGIIAKEKYLWIEEVLRKFRYQHLKRTGKGMLRKYISKVSGYSRAQVSRLVGIYQKTGHVKQTHYHRYCFPQKYDAADVALLATTDELHGWLSGPATKKILEREYEVYGNAAAKNICHISVAQIYNLRRSKRNGGKRYIPTRPVVIKIGERTKPQPQG